MDKKDKEKWINEALDSMEGINPAEPSPFLYAKVLNRIKSGSGVNSYIPLKKAALGFMTILLLAVLNIAVIFNMNSTTITTETKNDANSNSSEFIPAQTNPYLEILSK